MMDIFFVVSDEEFSEYTKFCETHEFLLTPMQKDSYFIKESDLLT